MRARCGADCRFTSKLGSCCRSTCIAFGPCPKVDSDYPERWRRIKAGFSRALPGRRKGEGSLWQRGYWEHTIRDERDYAAHMDYIHFNSVKHGLVADPADWPYSTFRRCVAAGLYPRAWLGIRVLNPPKPANEIRRAGEAQRNPPLSMPKGGGLRYAPPALRFAGWYPKRSSNHSSSD